MKKHLLSFALIILFLGCTEKKETKTITIVEPVEEIVPEVHNTRVRYAKGFKVHNPMGFKQLVISNPWPGSDKTYKYALVKDTASIKNKSYFDGVIQIPLKSVVVTSTTHIPSLEMLGVTQRLVGFPNLDYISSEETRKRIDDGFIKELGKNEDINTEVLINLSPDAVITFAVDGDNKTVETIKKTGIPILYNADWTETSPLGKAEWIKFFGVLMGKEKTADSIFQVIEREYLATKVIAEQAINKPKVLSGAMYKDVWHLPQGGSWAAQFIADANGDYLWKDTEGTGSASLNVESVIAKGKNADFWIGPGQFTSLQQLNDAHSAYSQFNAFQNGQVYSFTNKKGATDGVIYYEEAPNRPDLVLKDMVHILHPNLLPNHTPYFFSKLD
ncbi:MAG TPA: ABC transporter substrate-binding protein [Flavobacteriaceae bacterium]|jgi:iron complex transport system substrate-binding protein|nr:ABC transporter substrate-binding protein [Flavobacteriaceae bacterium]MAY51688.1 ABC transporter substrate-binding protein [Flavobacteriaceae bacterium]HIB48275.1 ABC transporter substrate-binding protein [Flavobacteriaceae bacterium]HIO00064.1 ABC transporter substrate-binding protein [Flavobacteriaceae bacterium]|tara:strand:- start:17495 stop:18655 length:1161 start_codon:yes stop_codon:yes gene_type:complete